MVLLAPFRMGENTQDYSPDSSSGYLSVSQFQIIFFVQFLIVSNFIICRILIGRISEAKSS